MGLPSVVLSVAQNQVSIGEETSRHGMLVYLGDYSSVGLSEIRAAVADVLDDTSLRTTLSECSLKLVDGLGAERTVNSVLESV